MTDPIVQEIKEKVDIVDIIQHYLPLKKSGTNYKAPCPFHPEKTPSFMVNRERQLFRCFGCGETGDVFAFIMKQENIDFPAALELLANKAGVALPEKKSGPSGVKINKSDLFAVNATAANLFHQILTSHPAGRTAKDYLLKRGVTEVSMETFLIGVAPPTSETLQTLFRKKQMAAGDVRLAGSPERFRNRLMFPLRDVIGNVVGFSGRALQAEQVPKYLNTAETPLFRKNSFLYGLYEGKKAVAEAKKIVLVEGQLDLVLAHQIGTQHTVATSGTALTEEHLRLMRRYTDTLLLALDNDAAGQKATLRSIQLALPFGFDVSVIVLPEGTDPGEIIATQPEIWHKALAKPNPAIHWLFRHFFLEEKKHSSEAERATIYDTLFPYIALLKDPVSRSYALQHLTLLLGLNQSQAVEESYATWRNGQEKKDDPKEKPTNTAETTPAPTATEAPLSPLAAKERNIIGIILVNPKLLGYDQLRLTTEDFIHPALQHLYKVILDWYNKSTNKLISTDLIPYLEQQLPAKSVQALQKLIFDTQTHVAEFTPEQFLHEYTMLLQAIRTRGRESRIESFASQIAQAEASGDRKKVIDLMRHMQTTLKQKEG